ncbi:hypothetical protein HDU77_000560 [Chytriomyces hyalinus]|nr:hypothetical protein HDU77_000560 [Chytriomyces hyalinus]
MNHSDEESPQLETKQEENSDDDDLSDFDVEAQIALELKLLPPEDFEEPDPELSESPVTPENHDEQRELPLEPSNSELDHPEILSNASSVPDKGPAAEADIATEFRLEIHTAPSVQNLEESERPLSLESGKLTRHTSEQIADGSTISLESTKSWTDLIADIRVQEETLEQTKHQIEMEVDEALGFIPLPEEEEAVKPFRRFSLYHPGPVREVEHPMQEMADKIGAAQISEEESVPTDDEHVLQVKNQVEDEINNMPEVCILGEYIGSQEEEEEAEASEEAYASSKELDEEKVKLDLEIQNINDSLGSEMDLLSQIRKDIEAFKLVSSETGPLSTTRRNTTIPRASPLGRMSTLAKPRIADEPWKSQDTLLRRRSLSLIESGSEAAPSFPRRPSTTDPAPASTQLPASVSQQTIAADGFDNNGEYEAFMQSGGLRRSLSSLSRRGSASPAPNTAAGDLLTAMPPRRISVSTDNDLDFRFESDSRRSSAFSMNSRRTSVYPEYATEEMKSLKHEERRLKIEYQTIINQTREHAKLQNDLTLLLETSQSHLSLQHRAVRATKMKVREYESRYKQLLHWLQVVAKVAFEREKDKAHALLQRAAKLFEKMKAKQEKVSKKAATTSHRLKGMIAMMNGLVGEGTQLEAKEEQVSNEVALLKQQLDEEMNLFQQKKAGMESALSKQLMEEEHNRLMEEKLLKEACMKQGADGSLIDIEELEFIEANERGLKKIPYLKEAIRLLYANFDNNYISSLRGLDYIQRLNAVSFNQNKLLTVDLGTLGSVKFFNAGANQISHVSMSSDNAKHMTWLDLSSNPLKEMPMISSEQLNVIDLHGTLVKDFKCIENLVNLVYLNLSRTKIPNGPLENIHECKILQYLGLARNKYTHVPEIHVNLLHVLDMDHNLITRLNITTWAPRLRILRLTGNKIDYIDSLSMCPFLVELYLADNKLEEPRFLLPITVCQNLEILDLSRNPVTSWPDFDQFCFYQFPRLRYLNEVFVSSNSKNLFRHPIQAILVLKHTRKFFTQASILSKSEIQLKLDQFDDYRRLVVYYQESLDDFMGPLFDPYTHFLQGPKDATSEMRYILQSGRLHWLVSTLREHSAEITRINGFAAPDVDMANAAMIVHFKSVMMECLGVFILACFRRRKCRRLYNRMRRRAIKIQRWWRKTIAHIKEERFLTLNLPRIIKAQAVVRGYQVRKAERKRKALDMELKQVLEERDDPLLSWASRDHDPSLDDSFKSFVTKHNLRKIESQKSNRTGRRTEVSPGIARIAPPSAPRIADEVMVMFSEQTEEQGWITNTETNQVMHHEELSTKNDSYVSDLVNFNPLKDYLQTTEAENQSQKLAEQKSSLGTHGGGRLEKSKPRHYWMAKAARERMLEARARKYSSSNDPLARLRQVYQKAYSGKPVASLTLRGVSAETGEDGNVFIHVPEERRKLEFQGSDHAHRHAEIHLPRIGAVEKVQDQEFIHHLEARERDGQAQQFTHHAEATERAAHHAEAKGQYGQEQQSIQQVEAMDRYENWSEDGSPYSYENRTIHEPASRGNPPEEGYLHSPERIAPHSQLPLYADTHLGSSFPYYQESNAGSSSFIHGESNSKPLASHFTSRSQVASIKSKQVPKKTAGYNVIYEWDIGGPSRIKRTKTPLPALPTHTSKMHELPSSKRDVIQPLFETSPGLTLLVNNYVANKVTGGITPRAVLPQIGGK